MAARSLALRTVPLREDEEMARAASDTQTLLDAIMTASRETESALKDVNINVAGLRSDVSHLGKSLDTLSLKVDAIDRDKAPRVDLSAAELRWKESITDLRARTEKDLSAKIGKDEFSVDSFENFSTRLDAIDKKVDELNAFRWKLIGSCTVIGTILGAFLGWLFRSH